MTAIVEVLTFAGCPNREAAVAIVERVAGELGVETDLRVVEIADAEAAERDRFLGSPTIRVGGRDIEPGAASRTDYAHCCRIYETHDGLRGLPDEAWVREALQAGR